jgi:hypothetical protein
MRGLLKKFSDRSAYCQYYTLKKQGCRFNETGHKGRAGSVNGGNHVAMHVYERSGPEFKHQAGNEGSEEKL